MRIPQLIFSSVVVLIAPCFAQVNTGAIVGNVTDQSGAAVSGAVIAVTNVGTQATRTVRTNPVGDYDIQALQIGGYSISAEAPGFKKTIRTGLTLDAGQRIKIDFSLDIGSITEQVAVTAAASLVNTQTSETGVVIKNQQVLDLPLNGRNFSQLIQLEPGVLVTTDGRISFNGLTTDGVNITVDGTDAANPDRPATADFGGQTQQNVLGIEFIDEFKTTKGVFSAELGRAVGGGVNVITKSGTNELHGTVFEFLRNDKLDARNFFAARKDALRNNQFGAALGGPLIRNKLFLFGGWEGVRVRRGLQITGDVPTQSLRDRMLAATPAYKQLLDLVPLPNAAGGNQDIGFHRRSDVFSNREDSLTARMDYHLSGNDTFFARYSFLDSTARTPSIAPQNATVYPAQNQSGTFSWQRLLGAAALNELRLGWNKQDIPRHEEAFIGPQDIGRLAGIVTTSFQRLLRASGGSYTILDNFSINKGSQAWKFGFENRRFHYGRTSYRTPDYQFDTVADLIAGTFNNVFITVGNPMRTFHESQWGVYAQNDWRVSSRLTLNLGLRYEYYSPVTEVNGNVYNVAGDPYGPFAPRGTPVWNPDKNNLGPRFGLAWDMNGNSRNVIRMGAGVFYSPSTYRELTFLGNDPALPYNLTLFRREIPSLRYPVDILSYDLASFPIPLDRTIFDRNARNTYSEQWSFNYQRQVMKDMAVQIGYAGNRGLKIWAAHFLNGIDPILGRRPITTAGQVSFQEHSGNSNYHSLQASVQKRFSHDFTFNGNYTFAKGISYSGVDTGIAGTPNPLIQDQDCWRCSRMLLPLNITHNFVLDGAWQAPFDRWLRATGGAGKRILDGWQVNAIVRLRTGLPINVTSGRDNRGNGNSAPQRPDYLGGAILVEDYRTSATHTYASKAVFAQANRGAFGNLGANVINGPGSQIVDLSLFKTIRLTERVRLQFRAESFNALNRANFSAPDSSRLAITSATFGQITAADRPRELQLALKLLF